MNKKEKYLIALAGLFHDIGKFYQRAIGETTSEKDKDEFKYAHAVLSARWIEKQKNIFEKVEEGLTAKLINWGARHHNPTEELESKLMQIADWYSSAHDREKILKDELNIMHSVFERVSFTKYKEGDEKNFGLYIPDKLELNEKNIFPKTTKGFIEDFQIKYFEDTEERVEKIFDVSSKKDINPKLKDTYSNLFENFENEFKNLSENFSNSLERFFYFCYYLLQKYTWSVPASTYDYEKFSNHYPDISLFDHSRVLSAIATSLYDYSLEKGITKPKKNSTETFDNEEAFLLIEGDVGGIQKFLFNIYKTSEASEAEFSIAKALRGRSFFLAMLTEIFARYILKELGYPLTNAIYISSGKFQLLVANTEENKTKLSEIENKINRFLFDEFKLELNFVLATHTFKGKEFKVSNGFLNQIECLQIALDKKKKQKLGELIFNDLESLDEITREEGICPSCNSLPKEKDNLCKWCNLSQKIGEVIPKIKYIAFSSNDLPVEDKQKLDLGEFGKVFLLSDEDIKNRKNIELKEKLKNVKEVLILNETNLNEYINGFKFLGNTVPIITTENKEILKSIADEEIRKFIKEDNVLPFEILVKFAQGDKKLGFFRADVDNLGLILSDGLRSIEVETEKDESNYTISRIASLSRMLDLFFSGYINKLAEEETKSYIDYLIKNKENLDLDLKNLVQKIEEKGLKQNFINSLIYIVYSGGDDLFIIAPYNLALSFAQKIREKFTEYTAKNPEFGLSGGLLFARHNLPINLVAKYAEKLEEKAKTGTKDKIAIFQKAYKWKDFGIGQSSLVNCENDQSLEEFYFDEIEKQIKNFVEIYNYKDEKGNKREIISRSFLYNLLTLYKSYVEEDNENIKINPIIFPKLHYQIARNVKDKENKDVRDKLIKPLLNIDNDWIIKNLDTIVSLILMKTRKGG